jgi:hypothetical protein
MSTVPTDGDGNAGGARPMEPWAPGAKCYVCGRLVAALIGHGNPGAQSPAPPRDRAL